MNILKSSSLEDLNKMLNKLQCYDAKTYDDIESVISNIMNVMVQYGYP